MAPQSFIDWKNLCRLRRTPRKREKDKFVSQLQVTESGTSTTCAERKRKEAVFYYNCSKKGNRLPSPAPRAAELKRSGKWWVSCGGAGDAAQNLLPAFSLSLSRAHTNRITPQLSALHTLSRRTATSSSVLSLFNELLIKSWVFGWVGEWARERRGRPPGCRSQNLFATCLRSWWIFYDLINPGKRGGTVKCFVLSENIGFIDWINLFVLPLLYKQSMHVNISSDKT